MTEPSASEILGVRVDPVTYDTAVERILRSASEGDDCKVTALAVHGLMEAVDSPDLRARLRTFALVCPDGQPLRWVLNLRHQAGLDDRVYGPELMRRLCRAAAERSIPIHLYGSDRTTLDELSIALERDNPGILIAGAAPSRFGKVSEDEMSQVATSIRDSGARICFVGLGCPRQEIFTHEISEHLSMPVIAVGAAFNYLAGRDREPPRWVQRAGMQWFYRLLRDPIRLWRRYLVLNPRFVLGVVVETVFGRRDDDCEQGQPRFEGWA